MLRRFSHLLHRLRHRRWLRSHLVLRRMLLIWHRFRRGIRVVIQVM